jgi:hypothetical protein
VGSDSPANLFHFSDRGDIGRFMPRPPLRHPEAEPYVYAVERRFSGLYLFPRECPRIGVWQPNGPISLFIDEQWETRWRSAHLFRYEFTLDGFVDCHDHGVWVSSSAVDPLAVVRIDDLASATDATVQVVKSLTAKAREFFDFGSQAFTFDGHVSMIRMSNLLDWPAPPGSPVRLL